MKRGCRFLISFLLVLLLIPNIAIFADSLKICTFENADIVVILNADGSADIKERWVVNYQQGSLVEKDLSFRKSQVQEWYLLR